MATATSEAHLVWTNSRADQPESLRPEHGVIAALSKPSPSHPDSNEDSLAVVRIGDEGLLLVVADGCGGMPAGDRASQVAIEAVTERIARSRNEEPVAAVLAAFDDANSAVTDLRLGAGSTLTALLIEGDRARAFSAGDSPALIVGQRGAVRFVSLAHSPTGYGVEAGLMTESEAASHEDSGVVLNVLGFPEMFVHVGPPVTLRPMDTVVVASDGLTDNIPVDLVSKLCRVDSARAALESLAGEASRRMTEEPAGHPDDLSILLYRPTARRGD